MTDEIKIPKPRWGGRWQKPLREAWDEGRIALEDGQGLSDWTELAPYARTSGYQEARILNIISVLPKTPEGTRLEFGARTNTDGGSTLLVRLVEG